MKTISRKTFERNKRAGKYLRIIRETEAEAIVVPVEIRGLYANQPNTAGVTVTYEFSEYAAKVRAQIEDEETARQADALARLRAKGANV